MSLIDELRYSNSLASGWHSIMPGLLAEAEILMSGHSQAIPDDSLGVTAASSVILLIDDPVDNLYVLSELLRLQLEAKLTRDWMKQQNATLEAEMVIMQTHARRGSEAIEQAENDIARPLEFLSLAKEIALRHHEKWDGSGYPDGLAGAAIPLSARLMAVADVFDALISVRVYKPASSFADPRRIIASGHGKHFDPNITDSFQVGFKDFVAIASRHMDASNFPAVKTQSKALS